MTQFKIKIKDCKLIAAFEKNGILIGNQFLKYDFSSYVRLYKHYIFGYIVQFRIEKKETFIFHEDIKAAQRKFIDSIKILTANI